MDTLALGTFGIVRAVAMAVVQLSPEGVLEPLVAELEPLHAQKAPMASITTRPICQGIWTDLDSGRDACDCYYQLNLRPLHRNVADDGESPRNPEPQRPNCGEC